MVKYMQTKVPNYMKKGYNILNEEKRYYPEAIFDNYINHLELNDFIREDGTTKETNSKGEAIPTLEQYAEQKYEQKEIQQQIEYELQMSESETILPPIETTT